MDEQRAAELNSQLARVADKFARRPRYLYVPVEPDDPQLQAYQVKLAKLPIILVRRGDVRDLECTLSDLGDGGELYILGHGNYGAGIGTHDKYFDARQLVKELRDDSLPQFPTEPVTVYLFACSGAVAVRRANVKREPFVERFAQALAKALFHNYYVVAFAGVLNRQDHVYQDYRLDTNEGERNVGMVDGYVVYQVEHGDYNRVRGKDWKGYIDDQNVYRVRRRNS